MDRSPDVIRAQMSATRASLDRRLDRIEAKLDSWRPSRVVPDAWNRASPYAAIGAVVAGTALLIGNIIRIRARRRLVPAHGGVELDEARVICAVLPPRE